MYSPLNFSGYASATERLTLEVVTKKLTKQVKKRGYRLARQTRESKEKIVSTGGVRFRKHVVDSIFQVGTQAMKARKKALGEADHPYASRHSQPGTAGSWNNPWWRIYSSGNLVKRMWSRTDRAGWTATYHIGFGADYAAALTGGSTKLHGRDILAILAGIPAIQDDVFEEMERKTVELLSIGWGD